MEKGKLLILLLNNVLLFLNVMFHSPSFVSIVDLLATCVVARGMGDNYCRGVRKFTFGDFYVIFHNILNEIKKVQQKILRKNGKDKILPKITSASNKCCQNTNKTLILLDAPPSCEYPLPGSNWMRQVQEKPFFIK